MTGTTDEGSSPPAGLIERAEQWSRLEAMLADTMAGRGRAALMTGPVAGGKTELLHAFAGHAVRAGAVFVKAVCSRSERALPFGVVGQLFRTLELPPESAEDVELLLKTAAALPAGSTPELAAGERSMAQVLHALCLAMLDRARTRPVLIGVEDVRHVDPASLQWLLYLIRRLGSAQVLLVLTETAGPRRSHTPLHTELRRHPHCHRVSLGLLSEGGVAALYAGRPAPGGTARRAAASAHRVSGGNPLLVQALLEDRRIAEPGTATARPPGTAPPSVVPHTAEIAVGPNFPQALLSCLDRCEPDVLPVARAVAVLGEPAAPAPAALARLTRLDAETVAGAIDTMNGSGLLEAGRFRHPAARSAVLEDMSPGERKELCLDAAVLLYDEGAPATDVAPYVVLADHCEDASMVPVLEEAAEHALRKEHVEAAVRYLELAHRCRPHTRRLATTDVTLLLAESRINPASAARRLPALTAALRADELSDRDVTALITPLLWHGRVEEASEALDRARQRHADHGQDEQAAAQLRATELWLACSYPRLARRAQSQAEPAKRQGGLADPASGPLLTSATALAHVLTQGADDHAADHAVVDAEHVLQGARLSDSTSWSVEPALLALYALIYADRLDIARPWCDRLLEESRAGGTAVGQALFAAARAEIDLRRSELSAAYDQAEDALTLMPSAAWGVRVGLPLSCLITAATRMGRYSDAAAHLDRPVPKAMFQTRYGLHYLHARGQYYLATDRHYAALADFLSCRELMSGWGLDMPGLVPWRTSAAEAWLLRGGNRDEAKRLINEQLAKLGPGSSRTRGVALRLLAAVTKAHNRPQMLTEAVSILEERGDQYELARALGDLSSAHRALRAHRRAWTVARRAWHVANVCDATALCEELMPSRTRLDVPQRSDEGTEPIASLTDAERRVAALAAVGYTNREIAGKLCITASTIEQHLTRVYRKLNVKYRRELPADLHTYLPNTA